MLVRYYGIIRNVVKKDEEEITLEPGSTVGQLMEMLSSVYGQGFRGSLFRSTGELRPTAKVLVNGADLEPGQELRAPLGETKEVSIVVTLPMIAGG